MESCSNRLSFANHENVVMIEGQTCLRVLRRAIGCALAITERSEIGQPGKTHTYFQTKTIKIASFKQAG